MASRVGTGVSGTGNAVSSVSTAAKSTTTGNLMLAFIKWESGGNPISSVTDTAGNTYTAAVSTVTHSLGEPLCALYYKENATGNASNQVTVTFTGTGNNFIIIHAEEFSGLLTASSLDGTPTNGQGTSASFSASNITTTGAGLLFFGVGGYTALTGISGTPATPDLTIVTTGQNDTFIGYAISASGQTFSPAASANESDRWVAGAAAFKDASTGTYTLTAAQGSYSLTGQATGLTATHNPITAAQGSYSLTGQDILLSYNAARIMTADAGTYFIIGSDALVDTSMNAEQGTYTLSGQDAILTYTQLNAFSITAAQGSYSLTGQDSILLFGRAIPVTTGNYTLSGFATALLWSGAGGGGTGNYKYGRLSLSQIRIGL